MTKMRQMRHYTRVSHTVSFPPFQQAFEGYSPFSGMSHKCPEEAGRY